MENDEIVLEVKKEEKKQQSKKNSPRVNSKSSKVAKHPILRSILIIAIAIVSIILIINSSLFNIREIKVEGNSILSENKVVSVSTLNMDENIFKFNKKNVRKVLLENPYIEDVTISRKLPSTVIIKIDERIPTYVLQFTDSYVYINNQGYMLEISNDKPDIPVLVGFTTDLSNIKVGNRLDNKDLEKMNTVIKIYETAKNVDLAQYITKIDMSDTKEYKVTMDELGKTIYLGDASDLNSKMLDLKEILHKTQNKSGIVFLNMDLNTQRAYFRQNID